jgi:hypothetical protein
MEAISAFVDFHYGTKREGNLTECFVKLLILALEHELATSAVGSRTKGSVLGPSTDGDIFEVGH